LTPVLSRPQYSFAPPPYLPPGCGSSLIDLFAHRTSPPSSRPARASLHRSAAAAAAVAAAAVAAAAVAVAVLRSRQGVARYGVVELFGIHVASLHGVHRLLLLLLLSPSKASCCTALPIAPIRSRCWNHATGRVWHGLASPQLTRLLGLTTVPPSHGFLCGMLMLTAAAAATTALFFLAHETMNVGRRHGHVRRRRRG